MSYPITDIDGIDGEVAAALKSAGIRSTDRLLEAARTVKGRKTLAAKTGFGREAIVVLGQCRQPHADQRHQQGIRRTLTSRRCGHCKRTQVSQSAQSGQGDGGREQKAQSRPPVAVGKGGQALDRKRQIVATQNHLLTASRLLDSPPPTAQSDRYGKRPHIGYVRRNRAKISAK